MHYSAIRFFVYITVILFLVMAQTVAADLPAGSADDPEITDLILTGNFSGYITMENGNEKQRVGLIVTDQGDGLYHAVLHFGGLPWEQEEADSEDRTVELQGTYSDHTLRLTGDFPWNFQFILNRYTALDENNNYMGHLERVIRIEPNS
jgi:hypothetical protein